MLEELNFKKDGHVLSFCYQKDNSLFIDIISMNDNDMDYYFVSKNDLEYEPFLHLYKNIINDNNNTIYNKLVNNNIITWYSDDEDIKTAHYLEISKNDLGISIKRYINYDSYNYLNIGQTSVMININNSKYGKYSKYFIDLFNELEIINKSNKLINKKN